MLVMLLVSSLFAGVIEEAAFRGYMQGPIEKQHGPVIAILINGVMFAVAHLDFTPVLLPYYLAVAAIYGAVAYLTNSTLPAIVLHTAGNIYSNTDLWLHGRAEWQAPAAGAGMIWVSGPDRAFWISLGIFTTLFAVMVWAYFRLAASVRSSNPPIVV
jgi:membrane protease YdiL (CAAX protease family)